MFCHGVHIPVLYALFSFNKNKFHTGQKSIYILPGDDYDERYRLSTFEHFPYQKQNLNLTYFAKCGFSYTGFKDRLKCYR